MHDSVCPYCGAEMDEDAQCPECGYWQDSEALEPFTDDDIALMGIDN